MRVAIAFLAVTVLSSLVIVLGCASPPAQPTQTKPTAAAQSAQPIKAAESTKAPSQATSPEATKPAASVSTAVFPEKGKPITVIVPMAAGGTADISGRLLAAGLEKVLGTPVQVVNKAGASSQVGITELVRSKPDGYTIALTFHPTINTVYLDKSRNAGYDLNSIQPLALVDSDPYVVSVLPGGPYKGVKDLVDAAKAKPGQVKAALPGIMTGQHIATVLWEKAAGVSFSQVQFDSGGQMLTALLGGHVDFTVQGSGAVMDQVKAGGVNAVAILTSQESKFLPGVKTMESQGFKVLGSNTYGLIGPAGVPKAAVDILSTAVKKVMEDPDFIARSEQLGRTSMYLDSAAFTKYWEQMDAELKPIVEEVAKQSSAK